MFKKGNDARIVPAALAAAGGGKRGMFSVLGQDVTITGNIDASSDLHIDGRVDGDVTCTMLAQGADSVITGHVTADIVRIAGTVRGSVKARELTVERSASIEGDVEYQVVTVETGARIDGRMHHHAPVAEEAPVTDNVLFMGAVEQG